MVSQALTLLSSVTSLCPSLPPPLCAASPVIFSFLGPDDRRVCVWCVVSLCRKSSLSKLEILFSKILQQKVVIGLIVIFFCLVFFFYVATWLFCIVQIYKYQWYYLTSLRNDLFYNAWAVNLIKSQWFVKEVISADGGDVRNISLFADAVRRR